MYIDTINLKSFKNLNKNFEFSGGVNLLIAKNGWGKTNLLEAIDYLSYLKSFRGVSDFDLLEWNTNNQFAKLHAKIREHSKVTNLTAVISKDINKERAVNKLFQIDSTKTNPKKFRSNFFSILYSPHNADIVSASPDIRRQFFDKWISKFDPNYEKFTKEYKFVLKSKNKLLLRLQNNSSNTSELDYWIDRQVSLAREIISRRINFVEGIAPELTELSEKLFSKDLQDFYIVYKGKSVNDHGAMIIEQKIKDNIQKEIYAGMSLYGPHRDDFVFKLSGTPLREFGSRGQQRLAGIVLSLALASKYNQVHKKLPVLLFDDIMSELDQEHRENIEKEILENKIQTVLTSAEKQIFSKSFLQDVKLLGD